MHPMTWNDLPSIHDVPCLDDTDERCLEEIRTVVQKHGKARRFGVTLLHQHFTLSEDELLVEHCDFARRTLVTAPEKASDIIEHNYIPTVWRFDGQRAHACGYCPTHGNQHDGYKEPH
jgi:hypothetical protein